MLRKLTMKLNKIKGMVTNQYFILLLITLLALFIRLLNIDKSCGLWFDEMLTYIFSSKSFPVGILKTLWREDYHMPLYYMYVHIWMKFFGSADVILRLSSVLWGVLTIPAFFYLGKTYKSEKLGYFLSVIGCLSPIMIYYSQELRFYSMLMFFATISVIFFLKLIETANKKDFLVFFFSNLVILYIYTMGIIFVGIEIFILLIHFYLYKKNCFNKFIKYSAIFFLFSIPYLYLLISYINASSQALIVPFIWSQVNILAPLYLINDWFSPFMAGLYGPDIGIYENFFKSSNGLLTLFSVSVTSICFIVGFIASLIKLNKKLLYLIIILFSFLLIELVLCFRGDFILVSRYTLIALPIILLICTDGLLTIKFNFLKITCISFIFIIFIYNSVNYKNMPSHRVRAGGYAFPAKILKTFHLGQNDYIIFPSRSELLKKYINNVSFIDFDISGVFHIDKSKEEALKLFDKQFVLTTNKHNSLEKFTPYLLDPNPTEELEHFLNLSIQKIPQGNRLVMVESIYSNRIKPELMKGFINQYKKEKISPEGYKEMLFCFLYDKTSGDIKNVLNHSHKLKKIKEFTFPAPVGETKWRFNIYEKI